MLFCERLLDGYVVDDLVMAVFQKIKAKEMLEDHCSEGMPLMSTFTTCVVNIHYLCGQHSLLVWSIVTTCVVYSYYLCGL